MVKGLWVSEVPKRRGMKPGKLQEEEEMDPRTLLCLLQPEQQGNAGPTLCSCAQRKGHASKEIEFSLPGTTVVSHSLSALSHP